MNGINLIAVERTRQIENKGYEVRGDLVRYGNDELIRAAVVYAMPFDIREAELIPCTEGSNHGSTIKSFKQLLWPWGEKYWKPSSDRKRDLIKAGALIAAELDRMLLAEKGTIPEPSLKLAKGGFVVQPGMDKMTHIAELILELSLEDFNEVRDYAIKQLLNNDTDSKSVGEYNLAVVAGFKVIQEIIQKEQRRNGYKNS